MPDENSANLRELQLKAQQMLQDTASYSGPDIEAARGRLKRQIDAVRDLRAERNWCHAVYCGPVSRAVNQCVHEHTWLAIGAAALLGMLAGHCLSRRS